MSLRLRLLALGAVLLGALATAGTVAGRTDAAPAMKVTIDIRAAGGAEVASPANIAVRSGGRVTLTIVNHTRLFHTFTVKALGISAIVRPASHGRAGVTTVSFVAPYGVYTWRCVLCNTAAHPRSHAMAGRMYAIVDV